MKVKRIPVLFVKKGVCLLPILFILSIILSCYDPVGPNDKCYIKEINQTGKYLMHLEGSPYEIGYAMGYFRPEDVMRICHSEYYLGCIQDFYLGGLPEYMREAAVLILSLKCTYTATDIMIDILVNCIATQPLFNKLKEEIPEEYIEEMEGIAQGVNDALPGAHITLNHLVFFNIQRMLFTLDSNRPLSFLSRDNLHSCQGYVAFDEATDDGRVLMGRHYQWTDKVLHETTLVVEYVPENGYSFVSVTNPGTVGVLSAMNDQGVGIGLTSFNASLVTEESPPMSGMGAWLLARKIIQYSEDIDTAVMSAVAMVEAKEASSAFIIIGDDDGKATVLETYNFTAIIRSTDWVCPDQSCPEDQIEDKDDLVVVTNHALTPEMGMYDQRPDGDNSHFRYDVLTGLLLESYGTIDTQKGRDIIDFLHPPNYNYYGDDPNQTVKTHVAFFDLTHQEVWALYGHYNDPWAYHKLGN